MGMKLLPALLLCAALAAHASPIQESSIHELGASTEEKVGDLPSTNTITVQTHWLYYSNAACASGTGVTNGHIDDSSAACENSVDACKTCCSSNTNCVVLVWRGDAANKCRLKSACQAGGGGGNHVLYAKKLAEPGWNQ